MLADSRMDLKRGLREGKQAARMAVLSSMLVSVSRAVLEGDCTYSAQTWKESSLFTDKLVLRLSTWWKEHSQEWIGFREELA